MTSERTDLTPIALGFCITAAGILLLLHNLGLIDAVDALRYWPLALVLVGGAMMWSSLQGGRTHVSFGAVFWIVLLGAMFNHAFARRPSADAPLGPAPRTRRTVRRSRRCGCAHRREIL